MSLMMEWTSASNIGLMLSMGSGITRRQDSRSNWRLSSSLRYGNFIWPVHGVPESARPAQAYEYEQSWTTWCCSRNELEAFGALKCRPWENSNFDRHRSDKQPAEGEEVGKWLYVRRGLTSRESIWLRLVCADFCSSARYLIG